MKISDSCLNFFPLGLLALASLTLFFVGTEELQAEEKQSVPDDDVARETSAVAALLGKWKTSQTKDGQQSQYYFIKRPTMGGKLIYEFQNESQTSNGITDTDTSHKFKEQIEIKTAGWVYHPALMQYTLMIAPELTQTKEEMSPGDTTRTSAFTPDYSMTATFLEPKPYTLNIFANRLQEPVWAAFSGNTETITDSYGATGQLKYKVLPTTFGYSHNKTDQTGFYISQDIHDEFNLSSRHQTETSNTWLTSTYSDDQRNSDDFETQIKTLSSSLFNNYKITEDNNINLNSSMTYRNQDSTWYDTQNINFREHLNWRHRPNLQSNYSVTHNRQESGDFNSDMTDIEASLTHLLYENLTTNVGSRANQNNYSTGNENAYDGFLNFSYKRPLSWTTLGLYTGWDYLYTDRSGFTSSDALVTNETHSLGFNEEIYLNHYNVNLDSIVVTNSAGTIVYIVNIDYTVEKINDYVRISRLPFGAISDGQIVSVNYRYLRDAEYDDALLTENYGINFDLWHDWLFSYNFLRVTQDILSGQAPQNLVDDTVHNANIRYDIGWSNTSLSYEDNNRQSTSSYTRREIRETLYYRPQGQFYFSLTGYFGQTDYKDHDETRDFYGGVSSFDWLLSRWCKLRVEGYYDNSQGDFEATENNGIKAGLEFRYRIWTARLSYEFTDQNYSLTDNQRTEQLARFEIIRFMW
ncbi:MAG: hypothetical protein KJ900_02110 [Proteobacteria bacterium]|jgi:hypothetical protein|nr:hypothetical protein [Desulfocapsa sp.]MBU3944176.1 hypothetical protein [Pseudomonadota bacterium]MCG2745485.1 hypothetical protein [Desulfobacteraceae bacterium]MBU4028777.1 hypothetical protein [Pseudomonadota bacterium]MBU4041681.1 hypothetical protein [Pseudomonadota bacterium]